MIGTLHDKLQAAYDPSQNLRNEQPDYRPVIAAGTLEAFVEWLAQWRSFAERHRLIPPGPPQARQIDRGAAPCRGRPLSPPRSREARWV